MSLAIEHEHVVDALEAIETSLRIKKIPSLIKRAPAIEFDDISRQKTSIHSNGHDNDADNDNNNKKREGKIMSDNVNEEFNQKAIISEDGKAASLRRFKLRSFSLDLIELPVSSSTSSIPPQIDATQLFLTQLTSIDLSYNEIMEVPGLSAMNNLQHLNLERGWFNTIPNDIGSLEHLITLNVSRNFLRPNANSLQINQLKSLTKLKIFDLQYNQKCGTRQHYDYICNELQRVEEIKVTFWQDIGSKPGSYIGSCASERDPKLLRSQLEPWGTVQLRKRLVQDFNQVPTDASVVDRAVVMKRLLECYEKEGWVDEKTGYEQRQRVYVDGTPVPPDLMNELLIELRSWTKDTGLDNKNRERPSIDARNYMILRRPTSDEKEMCQVKKDVSMSNIGNGSCSGSRASRRALRKAKKLSKYRRIWDLALKALQNVDEAFATQCTEIAVTFGFQGSPHIDKQNSGPFYGLALGNFTAGQGGICVECSARVVAVVNTKDRLGRVDGRFPHWVNAYDKLNEQGNMVERYSLIYYETGSNFKQPGSAVFSIPKHRHSL